MNRIKYLVLICLVLTCGMSCNHLFDQYNENPNDLEVGKVRPENLLEMLIFRTADGMLDRTYSLNGELIQYTASGNGTQAYHRYIIPNGVATSAWNWIAQWAYNANHLTEIAEQYDDVNHMAIGMTMKVFLLSNLTDIFGEIPYFDAFRLMDEELSKPRYNTQEEVYHDLYRLLEEANELYAPSLGLTNNSRDLLYGGDVAKWRKFNNSLYLRLLMRLSNRADDFRIETEDGSMTVQQKLQQVINDAVKYPLFEGIGDAAVVYFSGENQFENRFGGVTANSWNGHSLAQNLVELLLEVDDPRLSIIGNQNNTSQWKGMESGAPTVDTDDSGISKLNKNTLGDYSSPYSFMRYDEIKFILAEAAYTGLIPGGTMLAKQYYEEGIHASLDYWDSVNTEVSNVISEAKRTQLMVKLAYEGTLRQIMEQKYVAMFFVGFEAWHDYRRTELPLLNIGSGTSNDHILPRRLQYPSRSMTTNPVNYAEAIRRMNSNYRGGADDMKTPVWWSKAALEMANKQ